MTIAPPAVIQVRRLKRACVLAIAALAAALPTGVGAANVQILRQAGGDYGVKVMSYKEMPFRTVVHQERDFSCGSAALATLLRFHFGRSVDEAAIFAAMWKTGDQARIQKVGFSLLDMKAYLKSVGLDADGYRVPLSSLIAKQAPSIVVVRTGRYKHFVVLKGVRDGYALIGDPAFGLKAEKLSDFARTWEGIAFLIHGPPDVEATEFNRREDWAALTQPSLERALREQPSASALMRDLPPIYQLTTVFHVGPQ